MWKQWQISSSRALKSLRRWLQPCNQKTTASWQESYDNPTQCVQKQRRHFADKGPYSQGYGRPSSHIWLWHLDHKEHRRINWCFWTAVLEKTPETPLDSKGIKLVSLKGNQSWILIGGTDAEAEAPILWPPDAKSRLIGKDPDAGKDWRQKRVTEDEMVGWHHWCNGQELEQTPGDGEGQGSPACCSP